MMQYKGYVGKVEFDDGAGIFHGEVVGTRDVITFQADNVEELRKAFRDSVDDYLAFCAERGEKPNKPFSGRFATRIAPDLHRKANLAASEAGKSLNAWVSEQLESAVARAGIGNTGTTARKAKGRRRRTAKRESARQ
jgi:predicted HicB family RNase H-like nuclease